MPDRHSDYRDSHFSSETRKAMEQGKRGLDSQEHARTRLARKQAARRRKRERPEGNATEPPMEAIGPQRVIETPPSLLARFRGFLQSLNIEFFAPGGPEDVESAIMGKEHPRGKEALR